MSIRTDAVAAMVSMSHRSAAPEDRELPAADHVQKAAKGRWGRETKPGPQENILIDQDACLHDIFTQKDYVIPGYPIIYFAVKNSDFIAQLNLKEVILAGGRRRKLNEQEKAWLVPAPHPEDNKRKEHDGTLHIDNEQKK